MPEATIYIFFFLTYKHTCGESEGTDGHARGHNIEHGERKRDDAHQAYYSGQNNILDKTMIFSDRAMLNREKGKGMMRTRHIILFFFGKTMFFFQTEQCGAGRKERG